MAKKHYYPAAGSGNVAVVKSTSRRLTTVGWTRVASLPLLLNTILIPAQGNPKADPAIALNRTKRTSGYSIWKNAEVYDATFTTTGGVSGTETCYSYYDGTIYSGYDVPASYEKALAGTGSVLTADDSTYVVRAGVYPALSGADPIYIAYQGYIAFDTSSVPEGATITSVKMSLMSMRNRSLQDFTIQVYAQDFGGSLTTADWVDPRTITGDLLASHNTADGWTADTWYEFTSEAAFLDAIVCGGTTRVVVTSDRMVAGSGASTEEWMTAYDIDTDGETGVPKLVIEYTTSATPETLTDVVPVIDLVSGATNVVLADVYDMRDPYDYHNSFYSDDYGVTFTNKDDIYGAVAVAYDGSAILHMDGSTLSWSDDWMATSTDITPDLDALGFGEGEYSFAAASNDLSKILLVGTNAYPSLAQELIASLDTGATWSVVYTPSADSYVTANISPGGSYMYVTEEIQTPVALSPYVAISSSVDDGANWSSLLSYTYSSTVDKATPGIACSYDGRMLVATFGVGADGTAADDLIVTFSNDYGATFTAATHPGQPISTAYNAQCSNVADEGRYAIRYSTTVDLEEMLYVFDGTGILGSSPAHAYVWPLVFARGGETLYYRGDDADDPEHIRYWALTQGGTSQTVAITSVKARRTL